MSLTIIFIISMLAAIVICVASIFGGMAFLDADMPIGASVSYIVAAISAVAVVVSLIGWIWSYNVNNRETHNRCVESGGQIYRVNDGRYCLSEPPAISFKL